MNLSLDRAPLLPIAILLVAGILLFDLAEHRMENIAWPDVPVTTRAVLVGEPVVKEKTVTVDLLTIEGRHLLKARFMRNPHSEQLTIGDGLRFHSQIKKIHVWHSGHFNYQRHMLSHGYVGEVFIRQNNWQLERLSLSNLTWGQRLRLRFLLWRHKLLENYRNWGVQDNAYGIIAAMTLGERSQVDASLRETYAKVGAAHVLALSGLHLSIIYAVFSLFLSSRRFRTFSQILIVLTIWAYVFLVGLPVSVIRAAIMITVYALLSLGYRERMSVNTLAFTACVILCTNPLSIYDIGFQLSFMAVLAILLLTPLAEHMVSAAFLQRHRLLRTLWGLATVSISAQVGTAPLTMYYFGRLPTYFLLSNMVVIPLATLLLYIMLACLVFSWWSLLAKLLTTLASNIVLMMNTLLIYIGNLPFSSIDGIYLTHLGLFLSYVIIGCAYVLLCLKFPRRHYSI